MQVTQEQLEAYRFAKKADKDHPEVAMVERDPEQLEPKPERVAVEMPTNIARSVLSQCTMEKVALAELSKNGESASFSIIHDELPDDPIKTTFSLPGKRFPPTTKLIKEAEKTKPKARVAINSTYLRTLAALRNAVGGKGEIKFEIRGETDVVVASWCDAKGHQVRAYLAPMKLEAFQWERRYQPPKEPDGETENGEE